MALLRRWASDRNLIPAEVAYLARTRDRRPLRFSASGDDTAERAYRTHWVSPSLSEAKRQQLVDKRSRPPDLVVISPLKDRTCTACGGTGGLLIMEGPGPMCLECADLDHLVFLPAGDAALTRRAKKASGLSAVVVRFSRARKRYERQGLLVEEAALAAAERQCLADEEARQRRRARADEARARADVELQAAFAEAIEGSSHPAHPHGRPRSPATRRPAAAAASVARRPARRSRPRR